MNNNSMNHMTYEEFQERVKEELERTLGEDYQIEAKTILKNNGVLLDGVIIGYQNNQVRPTIYLNEYYQDYRRGTSLNRIISNIIKSYQEAKKHQEFDGFEYTLESMIEKIVFRIINYEQNKELLQESPHLPFVQDLVIVFYCVANLNEEGIGSIRITNDHMKHFGITLKELKVIAMNNTRRMFPEMISKMEDMILGLFEVADQNKQTNELGNTQGVMDLDHNSQLFVLTNKSKLFGAGCLLYPGVLHNFSELLQTDVIILPSSIHECVLLPATKDKEIESLRSMVQEINSSIVRKEEILSDNVYIYCRETDEIKIA